MTHTNALCAFFASVAKQFGATPLHINYWSLPLCGATGPSIDNIAIANCPRCHDILRHEAQESARE